MISAAKTGMPSILNDLLIFSCVILGNVLFIILYQAFVSLAKFMEESQYFFKEPRLNMMAMIMRLPGFELFGST